MPLIVALVSFVISRDIVWTVYFILRTAKVFKHLYFHKHKNQLSLQVYNNHVAYGNWKKTNQGIQH